VRIYGNSMPGRIKRSYRRYREGSSAFKVDFAIEGHIPWTNPECARAGMVHLGGTFAEIAFTERERAQGRMSERPFTLVGQQYLADPSRSSGKINPIWTYAHVPFGYPGDATATITDQIERFAPGFRERIVATVSKSTAELHAYNPITSAATSSAVPTTDCSWCSGPGWRSIRTSPACPASTCARNPRRPAPVSTGCAAITPPSRRCAGCTGKSAARSRDLNHRIRGAFPQLLGWRRAILQRTRRDK
jgi:phytoene dehydrogenase-like protein